MSIDLSIVCATINSAEEVNALLGSIDDAVEELQARFAVEVIIVDQNEKPIEEDILQFKNIPVAHIWSDVKGLSLNRNKGIAIAKGTWIMCTDADCKFDRRFFAELTLLIKKNPEATAFMGRLLSVECGEPIFRAWPNEPQQVSTFKSWQLATSVNCVWRRLEGHYFDELFGLGAKYGSCEDVDMMIRVSGTKLYSPSLIVYHPYQNTMQIPLAKTISYSYGFGALCKKHFMPFGFFYLAASLLKKAIDYCRGTVDFKILAATAKARIQGFISYRGN